MYFKFRAYYLLIGFLCFNSLQVGAQDQKMADSLVLIYESGNYAEDELVLLNNICINEQNPDRKLFFTDVLINKASKDSLIKFLYSGYLHKGNALLDKGNNSQALQSYFKSMDYANRSGLQIRIGSLMTSIADTYSMLGNSVNAQNYYKKSIKLLRKSNDSITIATALLNAGDDYFNANKLDSALLYSKEAETIFKILNYSIGHAYSLGNIGMVYAEQGHDEIAEKNISEAIKILEELEDYYPISVYLTYMSDIYLRKNNFAQALNYAMESLELSQRYGLKEQIRDANLQLSKLYEHEGNFEASNAYLKKYYSYRDSVLNIETVEQMADLRTNYEVSQKQTEVDLLNQQKRNQRIIVIATIIALVLIALLSIGLFRRNKFIHKTSQIIKEEKNRSDKLLLNILPEETALELKEKGKVEAKKFDSVSVLFTDFKGFTYYSGSLSPEELVKSVDFYYSKFDEIMEKYGLEKIKTIGDAYMAAGGLPFPTKDHAYKIVMAAFDIAAFVKESKKFNPADQTRFDVRIGINTGPVVAGVVGTKKFAYDIWGDTVNIASRMESKSEPGKINISENTYKLIKDKFECEYRGEIEVKNKGMMKMYFVNLKDEQTIADIAKLRS
jgi:class 3 adenylate cyclase